MEEHHCSLLAKPVRGLDVRDLADSRIVDCIDRIEQSKKSGRPVSISLRTNFDLLAQLKSLQITFLDDNGKKSYSFGHVELIGLPLQTRKGSWAWLWQVLASRDDEMI